MKTIARKKNITTKGFTLVEVLGSAFVAIIVFTVLAGMISQVYQVARVSKNKFVAVNLAKEGIELVRNMRDSNWLHYPVTAPGPETAIAWRGNGTNELKDICDRAGSDFYLVDAKDDVPVLKLPEGNEPEKLYLDSDGLIYTHAKNNQPSIFSRKITITTNGVSDSGFLATGGCGEIIDSVAEGQLKPLSFTVTSTVTWTEPSTGTEKTVTLSQDFYDWLIKRP